MIHLYFGEGKGKTTAAAGLALRALAAGQNVAAVQFLKDGNSGEMQVLRSLGAKVFCGKAAAGFFSSMTEAEREAARILHDKNLASALELAASGWCRLLVLDELCAAWNHGLVDEKRVARFLREPPPSLEIAITGRNPPPLFLELADYATEMRLVRHPFASGIRARRGVEF